MKILLDTNFLLVPVQFKIDIYEELRGNELITLDVCLSELKGKKGEKLARQIIKNVKVIKTSAKANADSAILSYAKKHKNIAVATNDRALIKALKSIGIIIIRTRQKKYLIRE